MKLSDLRREVIKDFGKDCIDKDSSNIKWVSILLENEFDISLLDKYKDDIDWEIFFEIQETTDEILERFEKYFDNCWEVICKNQILSENIILKYFGKFSTLYHLVYHQHLSLNLIEMIINDNRDKYNGSSNFFNDLIRYQFLEEDTIIKYIDKFDKLELLEYQKITPKIMNMLDIKSLNSNLKDQAIRRNYLYNTDIGKDWFIVYVCITYRLKRRNFYYPIFPSRRLLNYKSDFYGGLNKIVKARVFYKDLITLTNIKKVDIIREYDENNKINFYKR